MLNYDTKRKNVINALLKHAYFTINKKDIAGGFGQL